MMRKADKYKVSRYADVIYGRVSKQIQLSLDNDYDALVQAKCVLFSHCIHAPFTRHMNMSIQHTQCI